MSTQANNPGSTSPDTPDASGHGQPDYMTDQTAQTLPVASAPPTPAPTPAIQHRPVSTSLRVSTLVWGFVIMALGGLILAVGIGARMDMGLVVISTLAGAGLLLIAGSLVAALARSRKGLQDSPRV